MRNRLKEADGIDPDTVIMSPQEAKKQGMASTMTFPTGNLAPQGSVIKSAAIDPSVLDSEGIYRHTGRVKVFTAEKDAIRSIKLGLIQAGDILAVIGRGPSG